MGASDCSDPMAFLVLLLLTTLLSAAAGQNTTTCDLCEGLSTCSVLDGYYVGGEANCQAAESTVDELVERLEAAGCDEVKGKELFCFYVGYTNALQGSDTCAPQATPPPCKSGMPPRDDVPIARIDAHRFSPLFPPLRVFPPLQTARRF